jgi:hypothetical protein
MSKNLKMKMAHQNLKLYRMLEWAQGWGQALVQEWDQPII